MWLDKIRVAIWVGWSHRGHWRCKGDLRRWFLFGRKGFGSATKILGDEVCTGDRALVVLSCRHCRWCVIWGGRKGKMFKDNRRRRWKFYFVFLFLLSNYYYYLFRFLLIIFNLKLKGSFGIFRKIGELRVLTRDLGKLETHFWYFSKREVFFETSSN